MDDKNYLNDLELIQVTLLNVLPQILEKEFGYFVETNQYLPCLAESISKFWKKNNPANETQLIAARLLCGVNGRELHALGQLESLARRLNAPANHNGLTLVGVAA